MCRLEFKGCYWVNAATEVLRLMTGATDRFLNSQQRNQATDLRKMFLNLQNLQKKNWKDMARSCESYRETLLRDRPTKKSSIGVEYGGPSVGLVIKISYEIIQILTQADGLSQLFRLRTVHKKQISRSSYHLTFSTLL